MPFFFHKNVNFKANKVFLAPCRISLKIQKEIKGTYLLPINNSPQFLSSTHHVRIGSEQESPHGKVASPLHLLCSKL